MFTYYQEYKKLLKDNYLYVMVRGKLRQRFYSSRLYNRKRFLGSESTIYGGLTGPPQKVLYEE